MRSVTFRHIVSLLLGLLYYGCLNEKSPDGTEMNKLTDSEDEYQDSVRVFEADAMPAYEINFHQDVSFGSMEERFVMMNGGPNSLMRVDRFGRVFIPDRQQQLIHVFDGDGSYLTHLGGEGSGPGEFRQMSTIRINRDYLYMDDGILLRINVYSLQSLEFSNTKPLTTEDWNHIESLTELNYTGMFYVRDTGELLFRLTSLDTGDIAGMADPEARKHNRFQYVWFDRQGNPVSDPVYDQNNRQWVVQNFQGAPHAIHLPVHGEPLFAISDQGKMVSAWSDDFLIEVRSPDGEYLDRFYYPFEKRPLHREDLVQKFEDFPMSPKAQAARTIDLPESWPALQSIIIDDKERFWLSAIIDDPERDEWWVTESTGRLLARFLWPKEHTIAEVRNEYLYAFIEDPDTDERRIDRYRIEMKKIMAGSGDDDCRDADHCSFGCEKKQPGGGYLCSTCCTG